MPEKRIAAPIDVALEHGVPATPAPVDFTRVVDNLARVTESLALVVDRLDRLGASQGGFSAGTPREAAVTESAQINVHEDDPFSEGTVSPDPPTATPVPAPVPASGPPGLRVSINEPQPSPGRFAPGSAEFRYWTAAEALGRGIAFWAPLLPSGTVWSTANPMRVALVAGQDLNASYSRLNGLRFYQQVVRGVPIFSCESPDVVLHELGHAILDALRPELFNAASIEADAFHESFGDMSSILAGLQLSSLRRKVLAETQGRLNVDSRLSRLAEQLGWGIRQLSPTAVDRDSLRNAANRFAYDDPGKLPPRAPANRLSSESHSFSRVFTGAFLEALARMLRLIGASTESNLEAVSRDMGQILVDGITLASIQPAYFSQVAAAMVQADRARFSGRYRAALTAAFMERGILSPQSAMNLANLPVPQFTPTAARAVAMAPSGAEMLSYPDRLSTGHLAGPGATPELRTMAVAIGELSLRVHAPERAAEARLAAAPSIPGNDVAGQPDPAEAARSYVEDLMQNGRLRMEAARNLLPQAPEGESDSLRKTHYLRDTPDGRLLERSHFNCWCCR